MKRIVFCLMMIFTLISCSKDHEEDSTEYYVQYEVETRNGVYYSSNVYVNCSGGGTSSNNKVRSFNWSAVKGPFKKGDNIYLRVTAYEHTIKGRISVSKEGNPFVLKSEGTQKNELKLSYTIE